MTTGTEVVRRPISELVVEGANLDPQEWQPARVAALIQLLPSEFRDAGSAISLMARAQRSGLDPFIREIHAWKDQRGNLCFHTARDGWVRIAENDTDIDSLSFGVVYKGDEFSWRQDGRKIVVEHTGGMTVDKEIVGAYCVVHRPGSMADHIERRVMADYKHLLNKDNWRNYPEDMILTRVISAAVKFCSPLGAGIYTPDEADDVGGVAAVAAVDMDAKADALANRLGAVQEGEYEIVDEDKKDAPEPAPEPKPFDHQCEMCGEFYESKRSLAGHYKAHPDGRKAKAALPDGWAVTPERFGENWVYVTVDPNGELKDSKDSYVEACEWATQFVADEAFEAFEGDDAKPEKALEEATGAAIPVESPAEGAAVQRAATAAAPERKERPWTASRISSLISSHIEIGPDDFELLTGGANVLKLSDEELRLTGIALLGMIDERRADAAAG